MTAAVLTDAESAERVGIGAFRARIGLPDPSLRRAVATVLEGVPALRVALAEDPGPHHALARAWRMQCTRE